MAGRLGKKKNSNELDLYIKNIRDKIFQNDMWLKPEAKGKFFVGVGLRVLSNLSLSGIFILNTELKLN